MTPQIAIFLIISAAIYIGFVVFDPYSVRVRRRLSNLHGSDNESFAAGDSVGGETAGRIATWLQAILPHGEGSRQRLESKMAQAGIYNLNAVSNFRLAKVVCAMAMGSVGLVLAFMGLFPIVFSVPFTITLFAVGAMLPNLRLDRAIARRKLQLQISLPDFLDLTIVCLGGGMSLQETIRRVSDELRLAHPVLAAELTIVRRDVELGATIDQALRRFAKRSNYDGIRTLSTFIREAQKFGTQIDEALRSHADMMRTRREQMAEERSQKASVQILLPTLLLIFPATFVVLVAPAVIQLQALFFTD